MDVREQAMSLLIRSILAGDTRTGDQMIDVYVANGEVYLVGRCESELQRMVAEQLALGLPGVRHVTDNIQVRTFIA
jgi:osmotically-inducible protein OsmY